MPVAQSALGARIRTLASVDNLVRAIVVVLFGLMAILPMGFLGFATFRSDSPGLRTAHFALANWRAMLAPDVFRLVGHTITLSLVTTVGAALLGTCLAWLVARTDMPGRRVMETLLVVPILISPLLTALAWVALAGPNAGLLNVVLGSRLLHLAGPLFNIYTFGGMVFILILYFTPFIYLVTLAAFKSVDPDLEHASLVSGAGILTTMRRVVVPVIRPAILSGALMVFVLASEQFPVPVLLGLSAGYPTVQLEVYTAIIEYPTRPPYAATLAVVLTLLTACLLVVYWRLTRGSRRFVTISGKGFRPCLSRLGSPGWAALGFCTLYLILAVALPYAALVVGSLMSYITPDIRLSLLSLRNYQTIFERPDMLLALRNTLMYGLVGGVVVTMLAALVAWLTVHTRSTAARALELLAMAPLTIPSLAMALGLLWTYLYINIGIYGSAWILLIAYATRYTATGLRILSPTMLQLGPELEESARVHGSSRLRTLLRITLPILRPAILSTWILLFVYIILDISITLFLANARTATLAVQLWEQQAGGFTTISYGTAAILATIGLLAIGLSHRFVGTIRYVGHVEQ